jgi:transposase
LEAVVEAAEHAVTVGNAGYRQLRKFARRWPEATWAIEGAVGLGAPLTSRLAADGITVVYVAGAENPIHVL